MIPLSTTELVITAVTYRPVPVAVFVREEMRAARGWWLQGPLLARARVGVGHTQQMFMNGVLEMDD